MTPRDPHTGLPTAFPPIAPPEGPALERDRLRPVAGILIIGAMITAIVIAWSFLT
jgi:hypothetical protein